MPPQVRQLLAARLDAEPAPGWGPDAAFRDVQVGFDADDAPVLVREVRLVASLD